MAATATDPRVFHRQLPQAASVLAVVAHPDDESFGLGAVLAAFVDAGSAVAGVCLTHGEASTLGDQQSDLGRVRAEELAEAARALGIGEVRLFDHPDGALADLPVSELAGLVVAAARSHHADLLVAFDDTGITGHADHRQATRAALEAAERLDLSVLAWTIPETETTTLNAEYATSFVGRPSDEIDLDIVVGRDRQFAAIACHASQSTDNPVLWRRLALADRRERLRWLRRAGPAHTSIEGALPRTPRS